MGVGLVEISDMLKIIIPSDLLNVKVGCNNALSFYNFRDVHGLEHPGSYRGFVV